MFVSAALGIESQVSAPPVHDLAAKSGKLFEMAIPQVSDVELVETFLGYTHSGLTLWRLLLLDWILPQAR